MRVVIATVILWLLAGVQGKVRTSIAALADRQGLKFIILGALVGPVMGMSLSLVAVRMSNVGLASTLMALSPVILLPLGYWIFDEQITFRAVLGTAVALAGVAMIFLL
jgi:drug/metabolite transporter (DMT)-like permease